MDEVRDDLKQMLRQDLADFIIFFLFKKYLVAFRQEHIIVIAHAISESWAKRINNSSSIIDQSQMTAFMKEVLGDGTAFKQAKRDSDKIMQEEVESLCKMIHLIAKDSLYERSLIDTVHTEDKKPRKSKKL
jgi:hypothetical protein